MKTMTWLEFASAYCERQEQTIQGLNQVLRGLVARFNPVGFMLLECEMMDSSYLGSYTILPYGPSNTFLEPPKHPISPRGLASDMSLVKGVMLASELP